MFAGGNDLIPTGTQLFADTQSPHQCCQLFVSGAGWVVNNTPQIHQGRTGVGDFDAAGKNLYQRTTAGNGKILVDQCIGYGFPQRQRQLIRAAGGLPAALDPLKPESLENDLDSHFIKASLEICPRSNIKWARWQRFETGSELR